VSAAAPKASAEVVVAESVAAASIVSAAAPKHRSIVRLDVRHSHNPTNKNKDFGKRLCFEGILLLIIIVIDDVGVLAMVPG
jgi:hypothetical protein